MYYYAISNNTAIEIFENTQSFYFLVLLLDDILFPQFIANVTKQTTIKCMKIFGKTILTGRTNVCFTNYFLFNNVYCFIQFCVI